jgi:peroxin-1
MIAAETEGLSGADLQAVVYNAHLDVVQASIADVQEEESASEEPKSKGKGKGKAVEGKEKGKITDGFVNGDVTKVKSKGWKQVAPKGAPEIPGLSARVSLTVLRACSS